MTHSLLFLLDSAPPYFAFPPFTDSLTAAAISAAAFVLPLAAIAALTHRAVGHWTRFFAQWRRSSWWLLFSGAIFLAAGIFLLLGPIPIWQSQWNAWNAQPHTIDPVFLTFLQQSQQRLYTALNVSGSVIIAAAIALLIFGAIRYRHAVLIKRKAVSPRREWMVIPPGID